MAESRRILVVEDDLVTRLVMTGNLASIGRIDVAVDGQEAVEAVRVALQNGDPYALVFLDIMMPKMNGQEALQRIRTLEAENHVKPGTGARVVMTTGLHDLKTVRESYNDECDAFLVKPITRDRLLSELARLGIQ